MRGLGGVNGMGGVSHFLALGLQLVVKRMIGHEKVSARHIDVTHCYCGNSRGRDLPPEKKTTQKKTGVCSKCGL
jgi:hypothetical protein